MSQVRSLCLALALGAALGLRAENLEDCLANRPWLTELYAWQETHEAGREIEAKKAGAYSIGNGRSFAMIGLYDSLWTWSSVYGASYVAPELGGLRMRVLRRGTELSLGRQQIGWVRRSGVVRVKAELQGLTVETYDLAPVNSGQEAWDNPPALLRIVRVANTGEVDQGGLELELKLQPAWALKHTQGIDSNDVLLEQEPGKGKKRTFWRLGAFDSSETSVSPGQLRSRLPKLQPGEEVWAAYFLAASESDDEARALVERLRNLGPLPWLDQTRKYYRDWFDSGTQFSGDGKLPDLFEVTSLIFKSQQAHSGSFSPLIGYSYAWIRDNNGPIRWFLKTGHWAEARGPMDFFYKLAASNGALPNSIRVDVPLKPRRRNFSKMHVEHSETPDWVVMQHYWDALSTGELEYLRPRWDYLKRCLWGQLNFEDLYFFQRDETYLWCLEGRIFNQCPYPNYFLSTFAYSTDSSFELVAAAEQLARLGKALGQTRDAADLSRLADRVRAKAVQAYWDESQGFWLPGRSLLGPSYNAPFANILLNPFWCGFARNDLDPLGPTPNDAQRTSTGLRNGYRWLARPDQAWKTTPNVDFYVGMNPGQLLYSLCKARLPWTQPAYEWVMASTSPSGDYSEMYDGKDRPWNPPALGQGTRGRVRPWEGGLNVDALLEYVTGFTPNALRQRVSFAPYLPPKQRAFAAKRLPVGSAKISLELQRLNDRRWTATLSHEEGEDLDVVMDFWPHLRSIESVEPREAVACVDSNGAAQISSRCSFRLSVGETRSFTISEGPMLPKQDREPPMPAVYQAIPYTVEAGKLLLLTSPSATLNPEQYTYVKPERFFSLGLAEFNAVSKAVPRPAFLDMDLPISPQDLTQALLDANGQPRFKVVVLGRGAFSAGKHHFKPMAFWEDAQLASAVQSFLEQGGCLVVGPSYQSDESLPSWFTRLTLGWQSGQKGGTAVAAVELPPEMKRLDELLVGDESSELGHSLSVSGSAEAEQLSLELTPGLQPEQRESARRFTGHLQFRLRTKPGQAARVVLRVDSSRNIKGMALNVLKNGQWQQLGVRIHNLGLPRRFIDLFVDLPASMVGGQLTDLRVTSKFGEDITLLRVQSMQAEVPPEQALTRLLGFASGAELGELRNGLLPVSREWLAPLRVKERPAEAALICRRVGKGWVFRSELPLTELSGFLRALLKPGTLEQMAPLAQSLTATQLGALQRGD